MSISPVPVGLRRASWMAAVGALLVAAASVPAQRPKVEEEEPQPKRKVIRVADGDVKKPEKPGAQEPTPDLTTAARQWKAKNRVVYDFLDSVALPHDVVATLRAEKRVAPVARYLGSPPHFGGRIALQPYLDDEWVLDHRWEVTARDLTGITYYEQIVFSKVNDFLNQPLDKDSGQRTYVSRPEMLRLAEAALSSALRYHESARQLGQREGDEFDTMTNALHKRLLEVQLAELKGLADAGDWDGALALANRLADAFPNREEQLQIATPLAQLIGWAIETAKDDEEKLQEALRRLGQLEDRFSNTAALNPVNDKLKAQAEKLFARAQGLGEQGKKAEALDLLRKAEAIWPRLPGLHDYRLRLDNALMVLRVGVRDLPVSLVPGTTSTDSEAQALDLMFESLVKECGDPQTGTQRYVPGLAEGPALTIPLGRQFRLARGAFWSNDRPVTAADVRETVRLLKDPHWPGYQPAWADLLDEARIEDDLNRVSLTLRQGVPDPLALMTFQVLPAEPWPGQPLTPDRVREFAQSPVGSGPYQYAGRKRTPAGREYVSFTASPNYGSRGGRAGLPHLREIQFFRAGDPFKELQARMIDLVPDLPSDHVKAVQVADGLRVQTLPETRRIYFLAVNNRRPELQSEHVRRAISYAINREQALEALRGGLDKGLHHVLTGPFPAGSWACGPDPLEFGLDKARTNLAQAKEKDGVRDLELTLKYPDGDPALARAMKAVCDQVKEAGITLRPRPVAPHDLKQRVEGSHDYDLAYYHYDFPSAAYWLWPLFDNPKEGEPRGSNYLGYSDAELEALLRATVSHRDFSKVQAASHLIHARVDDRLPIIPLWQLDRHVAFTSDLKTVPFDPLQIFSDIDQWRLDRR